MSKEEFNRLKNKIIRKAIRKYGRIYPCGYNTKLDECFTWRGNAICFWFNIKDDTTHMLEEPAMGVTQLRNH